MWVNHQSSLLQSISSQSRNLFLSGDGRADSPGHSAKFGSYTVIDVFYNKVVDFKLVQVSMHTAAITLILDGKNCCAGKHAYGSYYTNTRWKHLFYRVMRLGEVIIWRRKD